MPHAFGRAAVALALALPLLGGCADMASNPPPLAPQVNLDRMMGRWYVVAHIPYSLERGFVGSIDNFSPLPNGEVEDDFYAHNRSFSAPWKKYAAQDTVLPNTNNARWSVSLFFPLHFPLLILYVDPTYQYAILGYPDHSLGWIYARKPEIGAAVYDRLLGRLTADGYDITKFKKVPQTPEQIGQLGFDTD